MLALCLPVLLSAAAPAADALPALSPSIEADADYLLTTADFMDAQFGMGIEAVEERESQVLVRTTGAEFAFDAAASALRLRQRLGKAREVAVASFAPGALADLRVARRGSGAVLLQARGGALQMRVNADSLLMVRDAQSLAVSCRVSLQPGTVRQQGGDFLFLDEYGGLGTYLATGSPGAGTMPEDPGADYTLDADQVLWIAVAPPRPYDWDASCRDRVVWHWSRETGYPSDAQIEEWSKYGNLLLQQAEVMLWKDWMLRFEPRNGLEEFERVNRTCERLGMRNYVYTSPHYFLTGTGGEGRAINSFEGFTGWVPGDGRGLNWPVFLAEIRKVMHEYKPDGLYFDGIYGNIVRTYLISRKAREVVGDDGILEYHATWSPPGGGVYLPQIDTYYTFILRGEGCPEMYEDPDYLRYFVSTHNISNSIGVLCNNNDYQLTEEFIGRLLDNNIRLHLIPGWLGDYRKEALETHYWPVLTDSLRPRVDAACARRQEAALDVWRAVVEAARQDVTGLREVYREDFSDPALALQAGPAPADRALQSQPPADPVYLDAPGGWRAYFSANSEGSLRAAEGVLEIRSRVNTCAYLERPLPDNVVAVQCRIRCPRDGGMSWGPGLLLGLGPAFVRIGPRADNRIGLDRPAGQSLVDGYPADTWYWVRLHLAAGHALYEVSLDGVNWRLLRFESVKPAAPRRLLVGKIANNGQNIEYSDLGGPGVSYLDEVRVYARPD